MHNKRFFMLFNCFLLNNNNNNNNSTKSNVTKHLSIILFKEKNVLQEIFFRMIHLSFKWKTQHLHHKCFFGHKYTTSALINYTFFSTSALHQINGFIFQNKETSSIEH